MGYYINKTTKGTINSANKFKELIDDGAIYIPDPGEWISNLVCIVDNGVWQAAAYCYNQEEYERFSGVDDRIIKWLEYQHVEEMSGYKEGVL